MTTAHNLWRSVWRGALGFGLGLALAGLTLGALHRSIHDFDTGLMLGTLLYAFAGALGGAALGLAQQSEDQAHRCMLAGAIGCGLGMFIVSIIISAYVDYNILGEFAWAIVNTIRLSVIGALTGASLGIAQKRWKPALWLSSAGALGFGLSYWASHLLFVVAPIIQLIPGARGEVVHDSIERAIFWCAWGAVGGIISGACLGMAHALCGARRRFQFHSAI
ncbi:MAG: hypothetical protein MI924_26820 [Chloroflexales bacterium]|nr:hypothetical protein [Chloroflexales bacterium]